ncbi:MAG: (4Fe-4S)-binding protein, partial [Dehalococcoidia bacterium]|nr:(4Fe-4S)-binding protein [Dehalococcoidia bacterium]
MPRKVKQYATDAIEVTFEPGLCIHSAHCLQGLPAVFDVRKRPWVTPENASAEAIARVIERCPSGALRYRRADGGSEEQTRPAASVRALP